MSGHSKVIFDALDDLVRDISEQVFSLHGQDVKKLLRDMVLMIYYCLLDIISESEKKKTKVSIN